MSIYSLIRRKMDNKASIRFQKFRRNHSTSFAATGRPCGCGNDHQSINILDDRMQVIETDVCPFMYNVRNACLRARYGNEVVPKIDGELLAKVARYDT